MFDVLFEAESEVHLQLVTRDGRLDVGELPVRLTVLTL
jgi:hypothetical protein